MPSRPSPPQPWVVAIDGPAGSGKSTVARRLAEALGWAYLDTGAMYRAVTVRALDRGIAPEDAGPIVALARAARIHLDPRTGQVTIDGQDVTEVIRTPRVNEAVSVVAAIPEVREVMVAHQRRFADENRRIVAEGRDIQTVVFPRAVAKVYLDAAEDVRVERRVEEMRRKDPGLDPAEVRQALLERDRLDRGREVAPLRPAEDAVHVNTSAVTPAKVLADLLALVRSLLPSDATA
jgi:cytidylate kinase